MWIYVHVVCVHVCLICLCAFPLSSSAFLTCSLRFPCVLKTVIGPWCCLFQENKRLLRSKGHILPDVRLSQLELI